MKEESLEKEYRDFSKTPSNAINDIQTPTLQKSLSSESLETPQDIRNIRAQFSVLKNHVLCEFLALNQKISSLCENLEKAVNDRRVQNRSVYLLHENFKILQNELFPKE